MLGLPHSGRLRHHSGQMRRGDRWSKKLVLYTTSQVVLLAASLAVAGISSREADWDPFWAVIVLGTLAVGAHAFAIRIGNQRLSASFIALVLAMVLLGPAPSAFFGALTMLVDGLRRRIRPLPWLNNLATYAFFPLAGAFLAAALLGSQLHSPSFLRTHGFELGLTAAGVFLLTNVLNFFLIAFHQRVTGGRTILSQARGLLLPM